ncbi:ribitol-5-phosphate dehydrogenase [Solibacillus sp. CAU 1738]|uniref:ribitol-5-phosphate dehydrogenase n=1 Tax=Solibacillus sp. CAU 1738 TaxID=3140363 RepID=UPI0032604062
MINQIYRLVSPRQFEVTYKDVNITSNLVVVRPTHLSICAADQRYYTGTRGEEAMKKKLPMALIHEGVGVVAYDPSGELLSGTKVVMVPNNPIEEDKFVAENYLRSSQFASSGYDGFMQDYVLLNRNRLVVLPDNIDMNIAAFTELVTIATHAISRFEHISIKRRGTFGVWGDGNLGFITSLLLKKIYPKCKVLLFGKTDYKMSNFSFVDEVYDIYDVQANVQIDHGFECVGGRGSSMAINQMIDHIKPEGSMSILGVSEFPVEINTRMVLEKGLIIIGSSRSGVADFEKTVEIYKQYPEVIDYLSILVGNVLKVKSIEEVTAAFDLDLSSSWGKTVMKWGI